MAIKASFGFGENVCWSNIARALIKQCEPLSASCKTEGISEIGAPTTHIATEWHRKWVTRQNVKVDRVACPWLIKRFIDPEAEFLFVPEDQLLGVAERESAIPFDAPNLPQVKLNHRGETCSFEAIIADYNLSAPGLTQLAAIVRAADVKGQETYAPEGPGLRAIAEGFAALNLSDEQRLLAEFPIYDALYAHAHRSAIAKAA